MATLILLGGNNPTNKTWIQEVNKILLPFYDTTYIHNYRHRNTKGTMDFEYECDTLCNYLNTIKGSIVAFCKSFGCLLALKAMVEKDIFIKQSIFVGFPLEYCKKNNFPLQKYLKEITTPILRIQHTNDPAGGYAAITKEVGSLSPAFTCKEIPGNTHEYPEIHILKNIILDANAT